MSEKGDYLVISLHSENAINDAIALLKTIKTNYANAEETRDINVKIAELEAERAKIHAKRLAYLAGKVGINPPSDDDVNKTEELVKEMDGFIAGAQAGKAIIRVATNIINIWSKTLKQA